MRVNRYFLFLSIALLFCASTLFAQKTHIRIFATAIGNDSGAFMGGSSMGSGLYQSDDTGQTWKHLGWENLKTFSMDMVQSSNGRILYVATGLGVLRSTDFGEHWKVITDWRISEVMDIAVNQKNPQEIYIATAHGPWRTRDGGITWKLLLSGLEVPYCSCVVIDSAFSNHVLLGAESGLFQLGFDSSWVEIPCYPIDDKNKNEVRITKVRSIQQQSAEFWQVASESNHIMLSRDSARSFIELELGSPSLWSVGGASGIFHSNTGPVNWNVILSGSANGLRLETSQYDVLESERDESVRNVSACYVGPIQSSLAKYVSIVGTLGSGLFVRDNRALEKHSTSSHSRSEKVNLFGKQKLPGRQIRAIKSFLVSE